MMQLSETAKAAVMAELETGCAEFLARDNAAANRAMLRIQDLFRKPFVDTRNIVNIVREEMGE